MGPGLRRDDNSILAFAGMTLLFWDCCLPLPAPSVGPEGPVRFVPGHAELQRMTAILPGERAPADATVPGAGGGGGGLCVSAAAPKREGAR